MYHTEVTAHAQTPHSGLVLGAPLAVRLVDPAVVFQERVGSRVVVYLDHNAWIELRDCRDLAATEAARLARRGVSDGRLIFPCSYASVSELMHVQVQADRERQAELMDELSNGVSFRLRNFVYEEEGKAIYRHFAGEADAAIHTFTRIVNWVGEGGLEFVPGTPVEAIPQLAEAMTALTLRWLVDHLDTDQIRTRHSQTDYPVRMNAQHDARWAAAAGERRLERTAVLTSERLALFEQHLRGAIQRAMLAGVGPEEHQRRLDDYRRRRGDGSAKRLGKILRKYAPAVEVSAQVFAGRQMQQTRRTSQQDFWDIEHAASGFAYSDVFVTLDGGLAALLGPPWMPRSAKAQLVTTMQGLRDYLAMLVG